MDIYEELGVKTYINANAFYTVQGGSMSAAPVIKAMAESAHRNVNLNELQLTVDDAIAQLTGLMHVDSPPRGIRLIDAFVLTVRHRKTRLALPAGPLPSA